MTSTKPVRKMNRDEMIQMVDVLLHPKGRGLSSEDLTYQLNVVCLNCPDPSAAMDILVETLPPITAEELVGRALSCPPRDIAAVPYSKLAENHPLRKMKFG
ncbi:hypothetical protein [Dyella tabacisoli]|uniref:hypothetical protein n=1 Tax=Dyella tabacisoli TaxID=2282381 RepID=UPI0013B3CE91|nr:hypothetical protein [Dyella tabacisoli]